MLQNNARFNTFVLIKKKLSTAVLTDAMIIYAPKKKKKKKDQLTHSDGQVLFFLLLNHLPSYHKTPPPVKKILIFFHIKERFIILTKISQVYMHKFFINSLFLGICFAIGYNPE